MIIYKVTLTNFQSSSSVTGYSLGYSHIQPDILKSLYFSSKEKAEIEIKKMEEAKIALGIITYSIQLTEINVID